MRPGEANMSFVQGRSVGHTVGQCQLQEKLHILYEEMFEPVYRARRRITTGGSNPYNANVKL